MKLRGSFPILTFTYSVSDFYIPKPGQQMEYRKIAGLIEGIYYRSQIHECRNWEQSLAVSFLEIFVSNFWCSAMLELDFNTPFNLPPPHPTALCHFISLTRVVPACTAESYKVHFPLTALIISDGDIDI